MYLDEGLSPAEQLKQTLSALPETTVSRGYTELHELNDFHLFEIHSSFHFYNVIVITYINE